VDSNGRTIWIVDAHRGDGKRFVVRADEKLTAFVELESACACGEWLDKPWPVKAGSAARHSHTISDGRSKLSVVGLKKQRGCRQNESTGSLRPKWKLLIFSE
jgi:hypothetical protein